MKAYSASSDMPARMCLSKSFFVNTGFGTIPVSPERYPYASRSSSRPMPDFPSYNACLTVSRSVPKQDHIPIPVITTLLAIVFFFSLLLFLYMPYFFHVYSPPLTEITSPVM